MLGGAFAWIAKASARLPYPVIAIQTAMMGSAMGAITIPATESILGVLPPPRPGSDRQSTPPLGDTGGTLRGAIIGSVYNLAVYQPADDRGDRPGARRPGRHQDLGRSRIRDPPPRQSAPRTIARSLARSSSGRNRMSPRWTTIRTTPNKE
jgi:hypothetical protein